MNKSKKTHSSHRNTTLLMVITACLAVFLLAEVVFLVFWSRKTPQGTTVPSETSPGTTQTSPSSESATKVTQNNMAQSTISTKYCDLSILEEHKEILMHQEVAEGIVAMEIFSMPYNDRNAELFRIYFGDEQAGTFVGFLSTEAGDISVSYDVCSYEEGFFQDEKVKELYYQLMDSFTVVLDSIYNNSGFREDDYTIPTKEQQASMEYWNVDMLEEIEWEETEQKDLYRANFYAELHGERTLLYSISLGEIESGDYTIGYFSVNGKYRPIWINVYALNITDAWTEDEITTGYRMLETLNAVTDAVIASENYTEDISQ